MEQEPHIYFILALSCHSKVDTIKFAGKVSFQGSSRYGIPDQLLHLLVQNSETSRKNMDLIVSLPQQLKVMD